MLLGGRGREVVGRRQRQVQEQQHTHRGVHGKGAR